MLPGPAYLPDLALYDFFLFPHLNKCLAGRSFKSWSVLDTADFLCLMHIAKEGYQSAFLQWIGRLEKYVAVELEGEYLESSSKKLSGVASLFCIKRLVFDTLYFTCKWTRTNNLHFVFLPYFSFEPCFPFGSIKLW